MVKGMVGVSGLIFAANGLLVPPQEPFHQPLHLTESISGLSFQFSHFLATYPSAISHFPIAFKMPHTLPWLPSTHMETLAWDIYLYSYREEGVNIFEELTAITKAFALDFHE